MVHSVFRPIFGMVASLLIILTLSRLALTAWLANQFHSTTEWSQVLFWGLRLDIQLVAAFSFLLLLATTLLAHRPTVSIWRWLTRIFLVAVIPATLLLEILTPSFLLEYGVRPNRLFFEYLGSPKEVGSMLLQSRLSMVFLGNAVLIFSLWAVWRLSHRWVDRSLWRRRDWVIAPLLLIVCFAGARGTADHRSLNPASAAITSSAMLNDLPMSSAYSLMYAVYRMKDESSVALQYGKMADDEVLRRVRMSSGVAAEKFIADTGTAHFQRAAAAHVFGKQKNYVLILLESLGAEFVGSLGGLPLTPEMDKLAEQGWAFSEMYATGTRSVRGIEAVTTGFLPSPARAVVKLPNAQQDFYTIASTLNQAGYHSQFLYGGNAHFDNMRRFLANNGFNEVIEGKDLPADAFQASWGVADEYVFDRLHQELMETTDGSDEKPRFTFAFTSTNHEPFDHPEGRVEAYNEPHATVENAVRYTDWALGRFFAQAKQSPYWENTVFLVVADHNSRVYSDQLVPIKRFHIPAMFLGGGISPRQSTNLSSQLDLPVTALSLLGIDSINPMIGRDLINSSQPGRAIMQFRNSQAFRVDDHVVILQPDKPASHWQYKDGKLKPTISNAELEADALAHALYANAAYQQRLYSASND